MARLDEEVAAKLCVAMQPYRVLAGAYVVREGEIGRECYLVAVGDLLATRGRERVAVLGKGALFGERALLGYGLGSEVGEAATATLARGLGQLQPFSAVLSQECMGQLVAFGPT